MESWDTHFPRLDARAHFNMTLNTSAVVENPWSRSNTTRMIIANLQLAQVQTLRTMHLTLGAFSLALTLLTVHRIVSDARRAAALQVPSKKIKRYVNLTIRKNLANDKQEIQCPPQCSSRRDIPTCAGMRCGHTTDYFRISAGHFPS